MTLYLNGTTGISGVDGSAGTPAVQGTDTNTGISFPAADTIAFNEGGAEVGRFDSSGRLLVGTSTSTNNLRNDGKFAIVSTGSSNLGGASFTNYGGTSAGTASVFDLQRSRGTTDGSMTAVASGDALGYIAFRGSDGTAFLNGAYIVAEVDATVSTNIVPGRLAFYTTNTSGTATERMRITSAGITSVFSSNQGFNTRVSTGAGTAEELIIGRHSATSTQDGTISFLVKTNGNVQNTNNSYGALSDIKLKENIVDATSQWNDLKALRVRNYNLKEGQTHRQIGLIAQEVEPITPGLVYETPDRDDEGNALGTTTKVVQYSVLYMKAVKALQEAMERIEQLEAEMAAVKAQLS